MPLSPIHSSFLATRQTHILTCNEAMAVVIQVLEDIARNKVCGSGVCLASGE